MIRILAAVLLVIWLMLLLMGRGGLIHLLLLNGIVIWTIDAVSIYRGSMSTR